LKSLWKNGGGMGGLLFSPSQFICLFLSSMAVRVFPSDDFVRSFSSERKFFFQILNPLQAMDRLLEVSIGLLYSTLKSFFHSIRKLFFRIHC
jgi:hypothetical protein